MGNRTVQRLMLETRRGDPIDSGRLRAMGISAALAAHMVKSGWLKRLSQGVYLLTGEPPHRDIWMGYHRDLRRLHRLRAFVDLAIKHVGP